jgi:hypothetical protein
MERIRNTFAILGVVSFIVLACSAVMDDESVETTLESVNTNSSAVVQSSGKYQVVVFQNISSGNRIGILNTETGVFRMYNRQGSSWVEYGTANNTFNF